jgi:alpha-galactosidase
MSAHLSASPNHQTHRATSFKTRGIVAMGGNFGYELDLNKLTDDEKEAVKKQIIDYNKYQQLVQGGDLYRLISPFKNRLHSAWEYVSPDKSEALLTFVVMRREIYSRYYLVKLRGLDPEKLYRSSDDGRVYSGALLMNAGVNLCKGYTDGDSLIIHFTEVK